MVYVKLLKLQSLVQDIVNVICKSRESGAAKTHLSQNSDLFQEPPVFSPKSVKMGS